MFDSAIDVEIFRYYVGEILAPALKFGDVVVMDNLPEHKGSAYSPALNTIEMMFAKLKHLLRSAAAQLADRLRTLLGDCLRCFSPDECARSLWQWRYRHSL